MIPYGSTGKDTTYLDLFIGTVRSYRNGSILWGLHPNIGDVQLFAVEAKWHRKPWHAFRSNYEKTGEKWMKVCLCYTKLQIYHNFRWLINQEINPLKSFLRNRCHFTHSTFSYFLEKKGRELSLKKVFFRK